MWSRNVVNLIYRSSLYIRVVSSTLLIHSCTIYYCLHRLSGHQVILGTHLCFTQRCIVPPYPRTSVDTRWIGSKWQALVTRYGTMLMLLILLPTTVSRVSTAMKGRNWWYTQVFCMPPTFCQAVNVHLHRCTFPFCHLVWGANVETSCLIVTPALFYRF